MGWVVKLSSRARYAVRMMIEIARSDERCVSLGYIAKRTKISRRYLEQLVHGLKQVSLVRGVSGRSGGYQLTRPASEILLSQIIESAIGPINIVDCVRQPEVCIKSDLCKCRWVYALINKRIVQVLERISLAELAAQGSLTEAQLGLLPDEPPCRGLAGGQELSEHPNQ